MPAASQNWDPKLPHNLEAERSVLGAILLEEGGSLLTKVAQQLATDDFFSPDHRKIWKTMLAMQERRLAINPLTIVDYLRSSGERVDGELVAYIDTLADGIPRINQAESHATIVAEKSRRRKLAHLAEAFKNSAIEDGHTPASELAARMEKAAREIGAQRATNGNGHFLYTLSDFLNTEFPAVEHLIENLLPRENNSMIIANPHHLKSYLTCGLALGASVQGTNILGKLEVKKAVRTIIFQIEEINGELQKRLRDFLRAPQFQGSNIQNVGIIPRSSFCPDWFPLLMGACEQFKPDWIVLDVLRRFFVGYGDINSPKDVPVFLEKLDTIRDRFGCHISLVHHENRKEAEIFAAAMGSGFFQTWAKTWIRLKRKTENKEAQTTSVEIEVDTALSSAPEPMRLVLDYGSASSRLRLEQLEDETDFADVMDALDQKKGWTVVDIAEHKGLHRSNAWRLIKKWRADARIEKVKEGHAGRGGQAVYRAINHPDDPPITTW